MILCANKTLDADAIVFYLLSLLLGCVYKLMLDSNIHVSCYK